MSRNSQSSNGSFNFDIVFHLEKMWSQPIGICENADLKKKSIIFNKQIFLYLDQQIMLFMDYGPLYGPTLAVEILKTSLYLWIYHKSKTEK